MRSFAVWRPVECAPPPPQAGALFSLLPRNCLSAGRLLETCVPRYTPPNCGGSDPQTPFIARIRRAPSFRYRPRHGARPWPLGFSHRRTSRRQTHTSSHARFRAGNGEERGRTQHAPNPATLQLANPQPHRVHPASVRGPWSRHCLEIATVLPGSTRPGAQPSARSPPAARWGSVIAGPRGARRPPVHTHALGPETGKSGGGPSTLATPPRSRSLTPSRIASTPHQSGAHGRVIA